MARLDRHGFIVMCIEPEGTWEYERLPAILSVTKAEIVADGIDTASVIAEVPPETSEITFFDGDGNPITTVPIDGGRATLDVTTTTPGEIRIRAGHETRTRLNEVVIRAVEAS
jgi:hypothetical protein